MTTPPTDPRRRRGFTLLEVLVAIAILTIVTATIYRFVDTTLRAAAFSQRSGDEDAAFSGFRRLVAAQLAALPPNQDGALVGLSTNKGHAGRRDSMQMICPAGNGLLAPDARGFYEATLNVRETPRGSGRFALFLECEPWAGEENDSEDEDTKPTSADPRSVLAPITNLRRPSEVRLMDNVNGLEIAYFDSRINGWQDKWTDPRTLPNLVRMRLGVVGRAEPYEIVERVPGGGVARVVTTPTRARVPGFELGGQTGTAQKPATLPNSPAANLPAPIRLAPPAPPAAPALGGGFQPMPIPGNTGPAFGGSGQPSR